MQLNPIHQRDYSLLHPPLFVTKNFSRQLELNLTLIKKLKKWLTEYLAVVYHQELDADSEGQEAAVTLARLISPSF